LIPLREPPRFYYGRLLLPLEDILWKLGYTIHQDDEHSLILITDENGYSATLFTGRDLAVINGETHALSMPAQVINGTIYTTIETIGALTDTLTGWCMETGIIRFRK
jgi:hypothetical protein